MKMALIAAGVLATVTFANPPTASAKDPQFGLTIGEPGPYRSPKDRHNGYDAYEHSYAHSYDGYYDLSQARASGYCMRPQEIGRRLHHYGWDDFHVVKLQPKYAVAYSYRHNDRYRINVDRCTGEVIKAEPLHRYGPQGYK